MTAAGKHVRTPGRWRLAFSPDLVALTWHPEIQNRDAAAEGVLDDHLSIITAGPISLTERDALTLLLGELVGSEMVSRVDLVVRPWTAPVGYAWPSAGTGCATPRASSLRNGSMPAVVDLLLPPLEQ